MSCNDKEKDELFTQKNTYILEYDYINLDEKAGHQIEHMENNTRLSHIKEMYCHLVNIVTGYSLAMQLQPRNWKRDNEK